MSKVKSLGIRRIESLLYYVHDLPRMRAFFIDKLDFTEIGASTPQLDAEGRQRSVALQAGECIVVLCAPHGEGGRAWRFLKKHPEGIGTIVYEVDDIAETFRLLESRGGTMITDIQSYKDDIGELKMFSITTPFGDTTFRFVERNGYQSLFPGFQFHAQPTGGQNRWKFGRIDHITANFQTMAPAVLWMEHVMGLERFWTVQFHTNDVASASGDPRATGSGLKSVVMHDPVSGVKFANNEPMRPFFKESQINIFAEDHRGDGIQHAALTIEDIIEGVTGLRERGVEFMPTPGTYYDNIQQHLDRTTVGKIEEDVATLRKLEILVDGEKPGRYLLQIFLKEQAGLFQNREAGPFFFEIIQRKGSEGFGAGNFRSLFESIERQQRAEGRV